MHLLDIRFVRSKSKIVDVTTALSRDGSSPISINLQKSDNSVCRVY